MVIAHAGHWATNLIYLMPLVAILAVLGCQKLRGRHDVTAGEAQPDRAASARARKSSREER